MRRTFGGSDNVRETAYQFDGRRFVEPIRSGAYAITLSVWDVGLSVWDVELGKPRTVWDQ